MRAILVASAISLFAIAPAMAQSCVSGGAFVPCTQPPPPMMSDAGVADEKPKGRRKASRRSAKRG